MKYICRYDEGHRRYPACAPQQIQQDKRRHQEAKGAQRDGGISPAEGQCFEFLRAESDHLVFQSDLRGQSFRLERARVPATVSLPR